MRSPEEKLAEAVEAWRRREAHERVARWRGDPDASPAGASTVQRDRLIGPRARELFEESADRGLLEGHERAVLLRGLHDAVVGPARAVAARLVRHALAAPVPYDSDHHRGAALLRRITLDPSASKRRGMARSLQPTFEAVIRARREGRSRVEEARSEAEWLASADPGDTVDAADVDGGAVLDATDEAWREVLERLSHAARAPAEHWTDLLHMLRQPKWDDSVPPRSRPRRLAEHLRGLGLEDALRHARLEPASRRLRSSVLVVEPRTDLRISPGRELGIASERDGFASLGHAATLLLAHPGLPSHVARPTAASVARTIGGLLAHLLSDPVFARHALTSLSATERRSVRELALGVELFELRTAAACCACASQDGQRDFLDAAHAQLERAWAVELPSVLAGAVCEDEGAANRLRGAQLAPALASSLRERFDEDFWRNPRCAEPIRHAASRGSTLSAETWAEELGFRPDALGARMTELLS